MNRADDPMYIPDRDLKLLIQAGDALGDKLMWAYRLGRMQGLLESAEHTVKTLRADTDQQARAAGL